MSNIEEDIKTILMNTTYFDDDPDTMNQVVAEIMELVEKEKSK